MGPDAAKVGNWEVAKAKEKKKRDDDAEVSGCWIKFRFLGCVSSRSKVDSSISGTSTQYGILSQPLSIKVFYIYYIVPYNHWHTRLCLFVSQLAIIML